MPHVHVATGRVEVDMCMTRWETSDTVWLGGRSAYSTIGPRQFARATHGLHRTYLLMAAIGMMPPASLQYYCTQWHTHI
jgi:hypothetical protein